MRNGVLRGARVLALAAAAGLLPGCLAVAVAAGAAAAYGVVKYTDNEAVSEFDDDADTVWRAALASLEENGYPVSQKADRVISGGEVKVNDVELHVLPVSSEVTKVTVRVGTFSNDTHKSRAATILHGIADRID